MSFFTKKNIKPSPLLIIKQDMNDTNVKEFKSIDEAIADLESDLNVSKEKIEKLKSSLLKLKNNSIIKIRNGEIIK